MYLKEIKQILGRKALLSSDIINSLSKKYPDVKKGTFYTSLSRYIKSGKLFCSKPLAFMSGEYAISSGVKHNYEKYLPLINKYMLGLSDIIKILKYHTGYISIFNLKKLLNISSNNQLDKIKTILSRLFENIKYDNDYFYIKKPIEDDEQSLYEKNRDRLLYSLINKHEKENIIFSHKVYYKTSDYQNVFVAGITFDAYSCSTVLQANDRKRVYVVYDFAIDGNYSINEAKCFQKRIQSLTNKIKCKVVPIAIFRKASPDTISFLKSIGVIILDFKSILGNNADDILFYLSKIDKNEYEADIFDKILSHISKYEQFDNIKGGLFEHLCHAILLKYKTNYNTSITCNYHLKNTDDNKTIAQFDILIKTFDSQTIICECKAYNTKMLYGKNDSKGSYSYFIKQVEKYKTINKDDNVKVIVFSANGFASQIKGKNPNLNNTSSEFSELTQLVSLETIKTNIRNKKLGIIWDNYFITKSK